jgi:hypothetical protein
VSLATVTSNLSHLHDNLLSSSCALLPYVNNFPVYNLIFLATILVAIPSLTTKLVIPITSQHPPGTNILSELARREPSFKHLVDFLERAVLDLGEVKVDPDDSYKTRRAPDPACKKKSMLVSLGVNEGEVMGE